MTTAQNGDRVTVKYSLSASGREAFNTSDKGKTPLEFTIGSGEVILGFDQAVRGMAVGESKSVTVPANLAHGRHRPERVMHFDHGAPLMPEDHARVSLFTITESSNSSVTQDYNHPLAGKDLQFEITVLEIRPAAPARVSAAAQDPRQSLG